MFGHGLDRLVHHKIGVRLQILRFHVQELVEVEFILHHDVDFVRFFRMVFNFCIQLIKRPIASNSE